MPSTCQLAVCNIVVFMRPWRPKPTRSEPSGAAQSTSSSIMVTEISLGFRVSIKTLGLGYITIAVIGVAQLTLDGGGFDEDGEGMRVNRENTYLFD